MVQQFRELLLATEHRSELARRVCGVEAALDRRFAIHAPNPVLAAESFDRNSTLGVREEVARELLRLVRNQDRVRLCLVLETCGKIYGHASHDTLRCKGTADGLADHHKPRCDADTAGK